MKQVQRATAKVGQFFAGKYEKIINLNYFNCVKINYTGNYRTTWIIATVFCSMMEKNLKATARLHKKCSRCRNQVFCTKETCSQYEWLKQSRYTIFIKKDPSAI